jgi:hypothetical protein
MPDALEELPLQIHRHDRELKCTRDAHLPTEAISDEVPLGQNTSQSPDYICPMSAVFISPEIILRISDNLSAFCFRLAIVFAHLWSQRCLFITFSM